MAARGFTLIETLISVGLVTLLAGVSLPVYQSFQSRNDMYINAQKTADWLRRAETYTRGSSADSQWGVSVASSTITLFKGTSFASRDSTFDEPFTVPAWVTVTGSMEVVFSKVTGLPASTGSVTFTSQTGSAQTVSVNSEGMVSL